MKAAKVTVLDRTQVSLVCLYLAISGIYWFPGVPTALLQNTKLALFGFLVLWGALSFKARSQTLNALLVSLTVCAVWAGSINTLTTDLNNGVDQARDFLEPMMWLIALAGIRRRSYLLFLRYLSFAVIATTLVFLAPMMVRIGAVPNLIPPTDFIAGTGDGLSVFGQDWRLEQVSLMGGGFTGQSTTFGTLVPPVTLLAGVLLQRKQTASGTSVFFAWVLLAGCLISLSTTGARGGTFVLALMGAVLVVDAAKKHVFYLFALGSIAALLIASSINLTQILPENFFRNFATGPVTFETIDTMMTGRLSTYVHGWEQFLRNPMTGVGPADAKLMLGTQVLDVHNVWLRILAESGLLLFVFASVPLAIVVSLIANKPKQMKLEQIHLPWPDTRAVLLSGLLLSCVEPSVMFGSFNASAILWTAIWLAVMGQARQTVSPNSRVRVQRSIGNSPWS